MASWRSIGNSWRALVALSWAERWRVCQAWVVLLAAHLCLRLLPFRTVRRLVQGRRRTQPGPGIAEARASAAEWHGAVQRAARHHLVPMHCLVRALATQWLLRRHGVATVLQFGVRVTGGRLAAHAWLEHEGEPIGEVQPIESRFSRLVATDPGS